MAGKKRKDQQPPQKHRQSLVDDEDAASAAASKKRARLPKPHQREQKLISSVLSSKILDEALKQQREIVREEEEKEPILARFPAPSVAEKEEEEEEDVDDFDGFSDTVSQYDAREEEIDEEDEQVLQLFMSKDAGPQPTLADIIIQKIKEKNSELASEVRPAPELDSAIIDLYKGVGRLLSRYTSGKLPKAFKFIPSIAPWEDVLYLTEPEKWSPNAMYQATRIFSSNLNSKKVERFYNFVLLPRVRDDIRKNKKLHMALYQSLKKSIYKPAAFFQGFLLPLCRSGTCTLREAVVIGSVMQKVTIPSLHSSAALMLLAEMEYCGTTSYFIKVLLDKKYALPYRVLDALIDHFMRFHKESRVMPVIWHQTLLAFVQRYKHEFTKEDKEKLHKLIQYQKHHLVTPEIRRELKDSRNRGEKEDDLMSTSSTFFVPTTKFEEDIWDMPEVPIEED